MDHRDQWRNHLALSTPFYLVQCFDVLWERIAGSAGPGTESSWEKSISLLISGETPPRTKGTECFWQSFCAGSSHPTCAQSDPLQLCGVVNHVFHPIFSIWGEGGGSGLSLSALPERGNCQLWFWGEAVLGV